MESDSYQTHRAVTQAGDLRPILAERRGSRLFVVIRDLAVHLVGGFWCAMLGGFEGVGILCSNWLFWDKQCLARRDGFYMIAIVCTNVWHRI
jgi:hypothetical protein